MLRQLLTADLKLEIVTNERRDALEFGGLAAVIIPRDVGFRQCQQLTTKNIRVVFLNPSYWHITFGLLANHFKEFAKTLKCL
jgi:hypothetical protein